MADHFSIADARARRSERAAELARIESGTLHVAKVIRRPPRALETVDIWDLLLRVPKLNRKGIRRICEEAKIWPHTPVGQLLRSERHELIKALPERVKHHG